MFFAAEKGQNPLIRQKRKETMPKQTGPNPFTGRRGNLQGYRMAGKYYVRIVSSLTAKRVRKDPAFKRTMQYAGLLGKASKVQAKQSVSDVILPLSHKGDCLIFTTES